MDEKIRLDSSVGRAKDWKSLCRWFDSTSSQAAYMKVLKIAVLENLGRSFSYLPLRNSSLKYFLFQRVLIPFRGKLKHGILIKISNKIHINYFQIRRIYKVIDYYPVLKNNCLIFFRFIFKYHYLRREEFLFYLIPLKTNLISFQTVSKKYNSKTTVIKYDSSKRKDHIKNYLKIKLNNFKGYILKTSYLTYKIYED